MSLEQELEEIALEHARNVIVTLMDKASGSVKDLVSGVTSRAEMAVRLSISHGGLEAQLELDYDAVPHLRYLIEGTGIYGPKGEGFTVVPRKAKSLHWYTDDGEDVFVSRVFNPGMRPKLPKDTIFRAIDLAFQEVLTPDG